MNMIWIDYRYSKWGYFTPDPVFSPLHKNILEFLEHFIFRRNYIAAESQNIFYSFYCYPNYGEKTKVPGGENWFQA